METINNLIGMDDEQQGNTIMWCIFAFVLTVTVACELINVTQFADVFKNQNPIIQGVVMFGVCSTGISIILGVLAKIKYFKGGVQEGIGWAFFAAELMIFAINTGLALQHLSPENFGTSLLGWKSLPILAGPIAVIGWIFILLFDPGNVAKREARNHQRKAQLARMDFERYQETMQLGLERSTFQTKMVVMQKTAKAHVDYVAQHMNSEAVQHHIEESAQRTAAEIAKLITGHYSMPATRRIVDGSSERRALPQAQARTQTTANKQTQINTNKKPLPQQNSGLLGGLKKAAANFFSTDGAPETVTLGGDEVEYEAPVSRPGPQNGQTGTDEENKAVMDQWDGEEDENEEMVSDPWQDVMNRLKESGVTPDVFLAKLGGGKERNTDQLEKVEDPIEKVHGVSNTKKLRRVLKKHATHQA